MGKKILLLFGLAALFVFVYFSAKKEGGTNTGIIKPISDSIKKSNPFAKLTKYNTSFKEDAPINILLLGIDRRSKEETGYRSDVMILVAINPQTKRVALVSLPRDLWVAGGRINAVYAQSGWEGIQAQFAEITGITPEKYILTDFEDFSWIIDAAGGVPVDIDTTFTDAEYPIDATHGYQTVNFIKGSDVLTGERALIFARSRHGNNSEGSDWMRMRRQHKILKGMLTAVLQPKSIFNPMNVEKAFNMVTTGRMETNLSLDDAKYLWDFYKDKDQYQIGSVFMDSNFVYNPPMSEYGGAWVLRPINNDYTPFHKAIRDFISGASQESTASSHT